MLEFTSYHIPSDFISSQQWVETNTIH
jgi:hypothetical protein